MTDGKLEARYEARPFYKGRRIRKQLPMPNAGNGLCLACGRDLKGKLARFYVEGVVGIDCDRRPDECAPMRIVQREWDFTRKEVERHA